MNVFCVSVVDLNDINTHQAMECVMTNMLEPGKTVLIANNGIWGIRSADMARRQGATVKEIVTAAGTNFSLAQLTAGGKEHKPDLLFVTHGESSTGVVQPLEGVGAMCHQNNCLLAVDTVASLGGVPVMADQLEIDVIYTGSQKVLGVPPGTAPISFSPRAVQAFKARTKPPCSFYLGEKSPAGRNLTVNVRLQTWAGWASTGPVGLTRAASITTPDPSTPCTPSGRGWRPSPRRDWRTAGGDTSSVLTSSTLVWLSWGWSCLSRTPTTDCPL